MVIPGNLVNILSLSTHTAPMRLVQEMLQGTEYRSGPHLQGPRVGSQSDRIRHARSRVRARAASSCTPLNRGAAFAYAERRPHPHARPTPAAPTLTATPTGQY